MATYVIGDVQGCWDSLRALLGAIGYQAGRDRVWLVGDLVNRGPGSLEVLRWARQQGDALTCVLGNHDLHLLAVAEGVATERPGDTLRPVLEAPDAPELLAWLDAQPLLYREDSWLVVHGGLLPAWTAAAAERIAGELQAALHGPERSALLRRVPPVPAPWSEDLPAIDRHRLALGAFTRARCLSSEGWLLEDFHGPLDQVPPGHVPWFDHPDRCWTDATVLFGHWAALGYRQGPGWIALDSGCVWGNQLTALRLEDRAVFQVEAREPRG